MNKITVLSTLLALPLAATLDLQEPSAQTQSAARAAVEATLRGIHQAAEDADGERFFGYLAEDVIYFGTDSSERWDLDGLKAFLGPYFEAGTGWRSNATEINVFLSEDARFAWFDERLASERWGEMRGTGVLREEGGRWKIVQYNTAFTVPNDLVPDLAERIRDAKKQR